MCPQWRVSLRRHDNIVSENCDWRDESSDDCRKQAVTVQTWRDVADCSRLARWQPGKLGRRTLTAVYGAQPETVTRLNADDVEPRRLPSGRGRRRGTTTLHPADTCKREGRAYSQSAPVLWASAAGGGAGWCGRISTRKTPSGQKN